MTNTTNTGHVIVRVPNVYLLTEPSPIWPGYFKFHTETLEYIYHLLRLTGAYSGQFHLQFKPSDDRLQLLCLEDKKNVTVLDLDRPEYRFRDPLTPLKSLALLLSDTVPLNPHQKVMNLLLRPSNTLHLMPIDVHVSIHSFGPTNHVELLLVNALSELHDSYFAYSLLSEDEISWLYEQVQIMKMGIHSQEL